MGTTVGAIAGGLLTRYAGWQFIFFFNVPIGALASASPKLVARADSTASGGAMTPSERSPSPSALVAFVYAISQAPAGWFGLRPAPWHARRGQRPAVAFLVIEFRVEAPLLPLRLFRVSTVAGSNAVGFLLGGASLPSSSSAPSTCNRCWGSRLSRPESPGWWLRSLRWLSRSFAEVGHQNVSQTRHGFRHGPDRGRDLVGNADPERRELLDDLAGPFFVAGMGTAFAFIAVSIGALAGVREHDAGVASGLLNTSQQLGGAIGVAIASSIAASRYHTLVHHGYGTAAALTGGFQWALWVCGLMGLAAVPVTFVFIRRTDMAHAVASTQQPRIAVAAVVE